MKRFWSKVDKTDGHGPRGQCWVWTASKRSKQGYGCFDFEKKTVAAHRFAYELQIGPIPKGMDVLHECDNPSCVRDDHLFLGTHQQNMSDMKSKDRTTHKRCPPGTGWCGECRTFKALECFSKDAHARNGIRRTCKGCQKIRWQARRAKLSATKEQKLRPVSK